MFSESSIYMDIFEFNVDEKLRPSVERKMTGTTKIDESVGLLPNDSLNVSINFCVSFLRLYRKVAPKSIRCRCVFDPSCSHYSELAIREHGVFKGVKLTFKRLCRCKPGSGGVDFSHLKQGRDYEL